MNNIASPVKASRKFDSKALALIALLLIGIACRFTGVMWDGGLHLHPDERFLTMTIPALRWPNSAAEYFQTNRAGLNPFNKPDLSFFVYGQLPLVIVKVIAGALGRDNYDGLLITGRLVSAFFDCGSILMVFLIGRRIAGRNFGLCAAALLALTALNIQQAHFFTVDTFASFFIVAAFYNALRWAEMPRDRFGALFAAETGLLLGAAMACKISSGLVLIPLLVLALYRFRRATWAVAFAELVLLFFVAFVVFRIANPIAFQGQARPDTWGGFLDIRLVPSENPRSFWNSLEQQREISEGTGDLPWNLQWLGRPDYIFPLRNLVLWGTGLPFGLAAISGLGLILVLALRRLTKQSKAAPHAALIAATIWSLLCFAYYGGQYSKFTRYYLAITPFLALAAAALLWELKRKHYTLARWAGGATLAATAVWALAVTSIYTRPHTRLSASNWIRTNIAAGTPVANETSWDDTLPIGANKLKMINLELYERDTPAKRALLLTKLDEAQWIFISSNRTWGSTQRLPMRYPLTTAFYRALFDGSLGFAPKKQFASYPEIFGFPIRDDSFEEALTVYDHPRVVLFQKTASWSALQAAAILNMQLATQGSDTPLANLRDSGWNPERDSAQPMPELPFVTAR